MIAEDVFEDHRFPSLFSPCGEEGGLSPDAPLGYNTRAMDRLKRILAFTPAAVYYAGIFFLSAQSSFRFKAPFSGFDKAVHGVEFAVLGALLAFGFLHSSAGMKSKDGRMSSAAWAIGVGLGILDEVHQIFVPGRSPDVFDAATDALGVALGIWLFVVLRRRRGAGL
jgi:hypothetical protein